MARKKTQEELETQNNSVAESEVQTVETKENNSANNENIESVMDSEIPKSVARLLKLFANYEELYVSESGSVYTTDTKPALRGKAILYKNPYFNNSKNNN